MARPARYLQISAYVLLTCIFVFVIGITKNCGKIPTTPVEGFSGKDTLDIAMIYGPAGYYLYGDTLDGINHAIALEFEKGTKTPIKIWPINDAATGFEKLQTGAFDAIASLPLDSYIKKNFLPSESVFLDRLVLIQNADTINGHSKVKSSIELAGDTVFVVAGSSALQRLSNLSDEIGGKIEIIETPELSEELLAIEVALGKKQLAVVNERVAKSLAEKYPNLHYDSSVSFTQFQVWIFNPSDSVNYNKFNKWLEEFLTTPNYRNIIRNY